MSRNFQAIENSIRSETHDFNWIKENVWLEFPREKIRRDQQVLLDLWRFLVPLHHLNLFEFSFLFRDAETFVHKITMRNFLLF